MKLNEYSNTVKRAISIAGITLAATTGCSKPDKKEVRQRDEQTEMVRETRGKVRAEKKYDVSPTGVTLEGKPITLPRPLVEKAKAEKKIFLPREVNDIGPLSGIPIEELVIEWTGRASRLKDLSPLVGAPLKRIEIHNSLIEDIEALRGMPLEEVDISHNAISDLAPLKGAKLKVLNISASPIESLEPIRGMPLEVFHMGSNSFHNFVETRDISPLKDCPLKEVNLNNVQISDISILKGKPIEVLRLDGTEIRDLSVLKGMPLRILSLAMTRVPDIEVLRGIQLTELTLSQTPVTDLSPLAGMPLEFLWLNEAATDLRPIKDIVDRLRKKEEKLLFISMSKEIDWETYQIVDKK